MTNLARIVEEETITSTTTLNSHQSSVISHQSFQSSVSNCSLLTVDCSLKKPGQQTWRVMCQLITNALDEGERDYAVPLDSQTIDLVMTTEPCWSSVEQALEEAGWDMNQWRLMDWWLPETDGVADAF